LARIASTRMGLSPEEAVELHGRVHALIKRLEREDAGIARFEREILPLSHEATLETIQALAEGNATPLEAADAIEFQAERSHALLALRVEREQTLQALADWVGLDLNHVSPAPSCPLPE